MNNTSTTAKEQEQNILQKIQQKRNHFQQWLRTLNMKRERLNEDIKNVNNFKQTFQMLCQSQNEADASKIQQMQDLNTELSYQISQQNLQSIKYQNQYYIRKIIELNEQVQVEQLRSEKIRKQLILCQKTNDYLRIKKQNYEGKITNNKQYKISLNNWIIKIKSAYEPVSNIDIGLLNNCKFSEYTYKKLIQLKKLYFSQKSTESELKNKKLHYEIMDSKEKSTNKNISSFLNKIGITDDEIDDKIVGFNRQLNQITDEIMRQNQDIKLIQQTNQEAIRNDCKEKSIAEYKRRIKNKAKLIYQLLQRINPQSQNEQEQIRSIYNSLQLLGKQLS